MSKTSSLAAIFAAIAISQPLHSDFDILREPPPKRTKEEINEHHGLKKFYFGDKIIYAINRKNANKKAKKLGLI